MEIIKHQLKFGEMKPRPLKKIVLIILHHQCGKGQTVEQIHEYHYPDRRGILQDDSVACGSQFVCDRKKSENAGHGQCSGKYGHIESEPVTGKYEIKSDDNR